MYKRYIALLLALCMLCSTLPGVDAAFAQTYEDVAPSTYATQNPSAQTRVSGMRFSENGVNFLKRQEGFTKYATWDYGQYSIGYGSGCDPSDYPNGITEAEADRLLREYVVTFENVVNNYMRRFGRGTGCQKSLAEFAPIAANQIQSFFAAACTSQKIHYRTQTCESSATGTWRVRCLSPAMFFREEELCRKTKFFDSLLPRPIWAGQTRNFCWRNT